MKKIRRWEISSSVKTKAKGKDLIVISNPDMPCEIFVGMPESNELSKEVQKYFAEILVKILNRSEYLY